MATWMDGPEYAPRERPSAFETPRSAPLESPPPVSNPAAGAPLEHPLFAPPGEPVAPLAQLAPAVGPTRDPRAAFSIVQSTMTSASAWGAAHSTSGVTAQPTWSPEQPLAHSAPTAITLTAPPPNFPPPQTVQSPFPAPGTPGWFAPPAAPGPVPPRTVTVAELWRAATPGVLVPLLIGAFFPTLSVVMLTLSFALSARVQYRRQLVRRLFTGAFSVLALIAAVSLFDDTLSMQSWWDVVSVWALIACWILPVLVGLAVGAGIRSGDRPDGPF